MSESVFENLQRMISSKSRQLITLAYLDDLRCTILPAPSDPPSLDNVVQEFEIMCVDATSFRKSGRRAQDRLLTLIVCRHLRSPFVWRSLGRFGRVQKFPERVVNEDGFCRSEGERESRRLQEVESMRRVGRDGSATRVEKSAKSCSRQAGFDEQGGSAPEADSEERLVDNLVHDEAASEVGIPCELSVELSDGVVALHRGVDVVHPFVTESCSLSSQSLRCEAARDSRTDLRQHSRSL